MSDMKKRYLHYARLDSFGSMSQRTIGPLSPHMNVVFGPNESGKTTFASFVGGVLFGWEEARGIRNTYKPDGAERAGSLFFAEVDAEGTATAQSEAAERPAAQTNPAQGGVAEGAAAAQGKAAEGDVERPCAAQMANNARTAAAPQADAQATETELRRVRNADGLVGDASIIADLDKDTFRTMFSLTSDELRDLRNTNDVTAKLLTAGAGTAASPAAALAAIDAQLATYTSRAAAYENSIVRLGAQRAGVREAMAEAAAEADRLRVQDSEFHKLGPERDALTAQVDAASARIESLTACRAGMEKIDAEASSLTHELGRLHDEERRTVADRRTREGVVGRNLARISGAEDRAIRDKIDSLSEQEVKQSHAVEAARSNYNASNAIYEALLETHDEERERKRARTQRIVQIAVAFAMFALLMSTGVPLFTQGRAAGSLSYTSLGLVMIAFGMVLALAAAVLAFRPNKKTEERAERVQEAQRIMLQDKKKLETCMADAAQLADTIMSELADMGLSAAGGSLRRARVLLDEAKDVRTDMALDQQRQQVASMRVTDVETRLAELERQKAALLERAGQPSSVTLADLDSAIAARATDRAQLMEKLDAVNRRWGELKQVLCAAQASHRFDELKNTQQQLKCRMDDARVDFARLLLARRMLQTAIDTWESKSQPEVYAQASRLLALMTDGAWTRVSIGSDGTLRVFDSQKNVREPHLLSLSTCQQLYLALRIALLMSATNVGRAIPVIADDILVNFDASRRVGAARALAELARTRQVILLTCHTEVLDVLTSVDASATVINL